MKIHFDRREMEENLRDLVDDTMYRRGEVYYRYGNVQWIDASTSTSEGEENTEPSMANVLETEIWHYVRRQRTWWKNDKRIRWFDPQDFKKIEKDMRLFLAQA